MAKRHSDAKEKNGVNIFALIHLLEDEMRNGQSVYLTNSNPSEMLKVLNKAYMFYTLTNSPKVLNRLVMFINMFEKTCGIQVYKNSQDIFTYQL